MRNRLLVILSIGLALMLAGGVFWFVVVHEDAGPANSLTPQEIAEGWTLLFDGESPKEWKIEGGATVQHGLLVLSGDRATTATTIRSYQNFELQFDYRFLFGQEGMLEMKQNGSGSSYGLGYLTPKPNVWNRAIYREKNGTTSLECKPLGKPLFQWVNSGPVQGTASGGGAGRVQIILNLGLPGNKLALRNVKLKTLP